MSVPNPISATTTSTHGTIVCPRCNTQLFYQFMLMKVPDITMEWQHDCNLLKFESNTGLNCVWSCPACSKVIVIAWHLETEDDSLSCSSSTINLNIKELDTDDVLVHTPPSKSEEDNNCMDPVSSILEQSPAPVAVAVAAAVVSSPVDKKRKVNNPYVKKKKSYPVFDDANKKKEAAVKPNNDAKTSNMKSNNNGWSSHERRFSFTRGYY